jgi:hypothetical protein
MSSSAKMFFLCVAGHSEVESVLPAEVVIKIRAITSDRSLSFPDIQDRIDKVMTALPAEVLDKMVLCHKPNL